MIDAETRRLVRERAFRQHGGKDDVDHLALACHRCNLRKGPNSGRATVEVLALNDPRRLELRQGLLGLGEPIWMAQPVLK